ncbi:LysR family transcriptional regulator [Ferrimonas gelatinilytica]|uniref:LysR family transcriptional regulator n=1 Tax=Ferrimonas gelatinilytica TaxID=1255257 RepID=A0ABP9RYI8_9GAMM
MKALQDLRIFVETARLGSLSAAARALALSPAVASAAMKRLEGELGQPLFVRSTRQLRLTRAGERFLESCQPALDLLDEGSASLREDELHLSGQINLSAPSDLGRRWLVDWLDEFMQHHPSLSVRLHLSDSLADLYRQPLDLVLRYGKPEDSSLVCLPISQENFRVLCASPSYLRQHPPPSTPRDLVGHNCLCFALGDRLHQSWRLVSGQAATSQSVVVQVSGNRAANDGDVVHRWALAGRGVAFKSLLDIGEDLAQGRLVRLCPAWRGEPVPLSLLCASRAQLSPSIQALKLFLQQKVASQLTQFMAL